MPPKTRSKARAKLAPGAERSNVHCTENTLAEHFPKPYCRTKKRSKKDKDADSEDRATLSDPWKPSLSPADLNSIYEIASSAPAPGISRNEDSSPTENMPIIGKSPDLSSDVVSAS